MKPTYPISFFRAGFGRVLAVTAIGMTGTSAQAGEAAPFPSPVLQAAVHDLPAGVIPGALPGSPPQAPDASNFDYTSLFHDLLADNPAGFVEIFDGKTLSGWDGDPNYWRVENGIIVGESTPEHPVTQNTFLISGAEAGRPTSN